MSTIVSFITKSLSWVVGRLAVGLRLIFPYWLRRRLIPVQYWVTALWNRYVDPGFARRLRRYDPATMPEASVLLITYNRLRMLRECLGSLLANTHGDNFEIIVWNNASTDGTKEYLDEIAAGHPEMRVVHHPENIGLNAVALLVKLARGYYTVELDDDVLRFPDDWLSKMVYAFKKVPRMGYLAANVVQDELTTGEKDPPEAYEAVDHDGVVLEHGPTWGWCTMTSLGVLDRVGNFPRRRGLKWYGEDLDYVRRVRRAGYTAAILRDVVVYHASGPAKNDEYGYLGLCLKKYEETAYAPYHVQAIREYVEKRSSTKE
jgi:GT2 family glycosyltransferase